MDIVYVPKETPFLLKAKELGCDIVYGEEMFLNQAAAQTSFWSGQKNT
jgi:shikimate 5-dehydrogenase